MMDPFEALKAKIKAFKERKRGPEQEQLDPLIETFENLRRLATDNAVTIELPYPPHGLHFLAFAPSGDVSLDGKVSFTPRFSSWQKLLHVTFTDALIALDYEVFENFIAIHCLQGFLNGEIEPNVK
jgi:hypothetical protein